MFLMDLLFNLFKKKSTENSAWKQPGWKSEETPLHKIIKAEKDVNKSKNK